MKKGTNPNQYGMRLDAAGVHTSRTMMLAELDLLLSAVSSPAASYQDYANAILEDNCLHKRSASNRLITLSNLRTLYALDANIPVFRILKHLWQKDAASLPLLAYLCAASRDSLLRKLSPWLLSQPLGSRIERRELEEQIIQLYPDRFSPKTLVSTSQNLNSTWTQAGFLQGRSRKIRKPAPLSPAALSYALILAFFSGARGMLVFEHEFLALLDSPKEDLLSLAELASRQGYLRLKRIGEVVELDFSAILSKPQP
ncbi:MAG: hypothetical protein PHC50_07785 [Candidatus Cloacimonetes bacterium]|nr:hypothetical protein [Candidatus Cloacimonadota bacterium]